jgi:hypothetical protein
MIGAIYANEVTAQTAAAIGATDTTVTLSSGQGAMFPQDMAAGSYAPGVIYNTAGAQEIVEINAVNGDVLTITRGAEDTTAQAWPAGSVVDQRITAGGLNTHPVAVAYSWPNGTLSASQTLFDMLLPYELEIPSGLELSLAQCDPGLVATQACELLSVPSGDAITSGTSIGSIGFTSGSTQGVLVGGGTTIPAGARIAAVGPASPDPTFTNVKITVVGYR